MKRVTTTVLKNYLKTVIKCPKWYIGAMDKNQEQAIAIYGNRRNLSQVSKYKNLQTYSILPITLLLRWGQYYDEAEEKANEIYELLKSKSFFIDNFSCFCDCLYEGPIDLRYR